MPNEEIDKRFEYMGIDFGPKDDYIIKKITDYCIEEVQGSKRICPSWLCRLALNYGRIDGIRMERERRKKKNK